MPENTVYIYTNVIAQNGDHYIRAATYIVHSKNRLVETTNKLVDMCLTKTFG